MQNHVRSKKKRIHNLHWLLERRRALRRRQTRAEAVFWNIVRRRQVMGRRFRRQHSIGPYIADFYCAAEQLIIELDGGIHQDPWRQEYDEKRTRYLEALGFRVIRFRNEDVLDEPEGVIQAIEASFLSALK